MKDCLVMALFCLICSSFVGSVEAHSLLPMGWDPFGAAQLESMESWSELRTRSVILQRYDRGCGPAALATVLRYVLGSDVTERALVDEMLLLRAGTEATEGGFTFANLIEAAEQRGFETLAGRAPLEELTNLTLPAIVLLDRPELRHFVVLWGVVEDRVHLGDPLIGNTTVPLSEFAQEWLGVLLIVLPSEEQMDQAVHMTLDHRSYLEQMSFRQSDPFALSRTHESLLGEGFPFLTPAPGEF